MKKLLLILIIFIQTTLLYGQQKEGTITKITLSGKVVDRKSQSPLEFTTIAVFKQHELISGGITDNKGKFKFEMPSGIYNIGIGSIGYISFEMESIQLTKDTNLGNIELAINVEQLKEVFIANEQKLQEIKLDKKIYYVSKDKNNKGKTVSQVLSSLPSLDVSANGTISLRGSINPTVLIDGNPSGIAGTNLNDYLLQLTTESIENIEVITNPNARYDAEGISGIINIILKKGKSNNLGIATTISTATPANHGISTSLSFRKNKTSLYAKGLYKYIMTIGKGTIDLEYLGEDTDSLKFTTERRKDERLLHLTFFNAGMFHRFNAQNSINFGFNIGNNKSANNSNIQYRDLDNNGTAIGISDRDSTDDEDEISIEGSLNYTRKFKNNTGISLSIEGNISTEDELSQIDTNIQSPIPSTSISQRVFSKQKEYAYLMQVDYEWPFKKNGKEFALGYKLTLDRLQNEFLVAQLEDSIWRPIPEFNDKFTNHLSIQAFYTQYTNTHENVSYSAGMRVEKTDRASNFGSTDTSIKKHYTNFFPSVQIGFEFSEKTQLNFGIGRRIRRPEIWTLNPFLSFANDRVYFSGNPELDPIYTNSYEANYIFSRKKIALDIALYHQLSKNIINYIIEPTDGVSTTENIIFRRFPVNNGNESKLGTDINVTFEMSNTFKILSNLNLYNSKITNTINGFYNSNQWLWYGKVNTQIKLPYNILSQVLIRYRSPRRNDSFRSDAIFTGEIALNKDILNGNGTIALIITDAFNTEKSQSITFQPSFISGNDYKYRQRQLNFSFTYRFNKQKRRSHSRDEKLKDEFEY